MNVKIIKTNKWIYLFLLRYILLQQKENWYLLKQISLNTKLHLWENSIKIKLMRPQVHELGPWKFPEFWQLKLSMPFLFSHTLSVSSQSLPYPSFINYLFYLNIIQIWISFIWENPIRNSQIFFYCTLLSFSSIST